MKSPSRSAINVDNLFRFLLINAFFLGFVLLETNSRKAYAAHCHCLDFTCRPDHRNCPENTPPDLFNQIESEFHKKIQSETWGQGGRGLYPAAFNATKALNPRIESLGDPSLDLERKEFLRPYYGNLVDEVKVIYNARLLSHWGSDRYRIDIPVRSAAQTFCNYIYVESPYNKDDSDQLVLIGHELMHSQQCKNLGGMNNFGYHYFKNYYISLSNNRTDLEAAYANNKLELEAKNTENYIQIAVDSTKNIATSRQEGGFHLCNNSSYNNISGAIAYKMMPENSAVQSDSGKKVKLMDYFSIGWFAIPRGKCVPVINGSTFNDLQSGSKVFVYAEATNSSGGKVFWKGNSNSPDDDAFCVHPRDKFTLSETCWSPNEYKTFKLALKKSPKFTEFYNFND